MFTGTYLVKGNCPICPWKEEVLGYYNYEDPEHKDNPTPEQIKGAIEDAKTKLQNIHKTAMTCLACDSIVNVS